jgi:DNA-binding transcriptional LysR family regulator
VIDKLEFLLALARERHFGRAAESCGVTQPTLSAGLKQLEDALGVLLVERGSRFHGFTTEGDRVLDWALRISGDMKAMKQEVDALKRGLAGHLRIAVIPTALPMTAALTTPFRARHPAVRFTILSRTSVEILALLTNFEIDAGITYLDNEPLGRTIGVPLYQERYCLLVPATSPLAKLERVGWHALGDTPLCLLTPDMQNRRIVDRVMQASGVAPSITLESDSMIALYAHVRAGGWASIVPAMFAELLAPGPEIKVIPLIEPEEIHAIGLVVPHREPMTPLTTALVAEAKRLPGVFR